MAGRDEEVQARLEAIAPIAHWRNVSCLPLANALPIVATYGTQWFVSASTGMTQDTDRLAVPRWQGPVGARSLA